MEPTSLTITYVPIESIKPNEYNPRQHTKEQAMQLKASIERYGLIDPLICNSAKGREHVLIGGHFRLEVAKSLGFTEVPVVYVSITDLEKEKELNLRLNKNTGEFDLEKLKAFNLDLLVDIGFEYKALDNLWDKTPKQATIEFPEESENKKEKKRIITKPGDLILLGEHRLICGDSTKPETIARL